MYSFIRMVCRFWGTKLPKCIHLGGVLGLELLILTQRICRILKSGHSRIASTFQMSARLSQPSWWCCSHIHVRDSWTGVVKYIMELSRDLDCSWIEHQDHASSMERQVPEVDTNMASGFPLWWTRASWTLSSAIDHIHREKEGAEGIYWGCFDCTSV